MSTYVDFFCVDCGEEGGFDNANRQHRSFFAILKYRSQLEHLNDELFADPATYYFTDDLGYLGKAAHFFSGHVGHRIVVKNEYGAIYSGCDGRPDYQSQTEEQRKAWRLRSCGLPPGHDGDHVPGEYAEYHCCHLAEGHAGDHNEDPNLPYVSNFCRANGHWVIS